MFQRTMAVLLLMAGVYDPDKPELPWAGVGPEGLPFEVFRSRWDDVLRVGVPVPESEPRRKAVGVRDRLAAKADLTPAERLKLALTRLRLREFEAALSDFQQAYRGDPRNFWALTGLGTAYQQTGQFAEAVPCLEAARELAPEDEAIRRLEATQLKLARLRLREQAGRSGRSGPPGNVDDIFGVRFVGLSGEFEAGTIAPDERAKLPADAIRTVQQLLYWLPDDTRLYWLLGELFNAQGDLDAALSVFNECLDARRFDAPKLREHRLAVKSAIAARPAPADESDDAWRPATARWVLAAGVAGPVLAALFFLQLRQFRRRR